MGTWFFASATGNFVAGKIAQATGSEALEGGDAELVAGSPAAIEYLETVNGVYSNIGWIAVGVGVGVIVISPLVKKLMHLDEFVEDGLEHQKDAEHSL